MRRHARLGVRRFTPALFFGVLITAAAAALFVMAFSISVRPADPILGPRLFPLAITGALAVLGLIYLASLWPQDASPVAEEDGGIRWGAAGLVATGLILFGVLIKPAGFILAETALFVLVARAFRSRRIVTDAAIGFGLALVIFVVFTQGLGLRLPAGPFSHLARLWS